MAITKGKDRLAEQHEQTLRDMQEQNGIDLESVEDEKYRRYGGVRKYNNRDKYLHGISGDLILDPVQFEIFTLSQRMKSLSGLFSEEQREKISQLLDVNNSIMERSTGWTNLGADYKLMADHLEEKGEATAHIDDALGEVDENNALFKQTYSVIAALISSVTRGYTAEEIDHNLNLRVNEEDEKKISHLLENEYQINYRDMIDVMKDAAALHRTYREAWRQENQEEAPAFHEAYMDVQEYEPGLAEAFIHNTEQHRTKGYTLAEKGFAVQNFDRTFEFIFTPEMREAMIGNGEDLFDHIYVEGRSMNDLWEQEYSAENYAAASELMKCRLMESVMSGRSVQVRVPTEPEQSIIPLHAVSSQESIADTVQAAVGSRESEMTDHMLLDEISASQSQLQQRSQYEKDEKRRKITRVIQRYPEMDTAEDSVHQGVLRTPYAANQEAEENWKKDIYALGQNAGKLGTAKLTQEEQNKLIRAGVAMFDKRLLDDQPSIDLKDFPIYANMGIIQQTQLYFIDGVPAYEYVAQKASRPLDPSKKADNDLVKAEIVAALSGAEHRIEMAKIGMDEYGNFQVGITSLQENLKILNGQERFYQRSPEKKAEAFYQKDPDREQRLSNIRRNMGEALVKAETRRLKQQEDPYLQAKQKFALFGRGVKVGGNEPEAQTEFWFGKENVDSMVDIVNRYGKDLPMEWRRGSKREFGAERLAAEFLTMARNRQIRYADLTDNSKYAAEKQQAAAEVAEAFRKLYPTQEGKIPDAVPMAEILGECMKMQTNLDLKKEILYALGRQEPVSKEEMSMLMEQRSPEVTGVLASVSNAAQSMMQAVTALSQGRVSGTMETVLFPQANANQFTQNLAASMTEKEKMEYLRANNFLRLGLLPENTIQREAVDALTGSPEGRSLKDVCSVRDAVREMIADGYEISQVSPDLSSAISRINSDIQLQEQLHEQFPLNEETDRKQMFANLYGSQENRAERIMRGETFMRMEMDQVGKERLSATGMEQKFSELEKTSGVETLGRAASCESVAQLYAISRQGSSLKDSMDTMLRPAQHKNNLEELKEALETHPLKKRDEQGNLTALSEREQKNALDFYAQMYATAGEWICEEVLPDINWKDTTQVLSRLSYMEKLGRLLIDFSQSMQGFKKNYKDAFTDAYQIQNGAHELGGADLMKQHDDSMHAVQYFCKATSTYLDHSAPLQQRLAGKYVMETYGDRMSGRRISDLGNGMLGEEMEVVMNATIMCAVEAGLSEQQMQDYLNGANKEIPILASMLQQKISDLVRINQPKTEKRKAIGLAELQAKENPAAESEQRRYRQTERQTSAKKEESKKRDHSL